MTSTKERPILFSAPMVRAILEGRKTQTRRICKAQPPADALWGSNGAEWMWLEDRDDVADRAIRCPYGVVGDRLWVRETHQALWAEDTAPDLDFAESAGNGWVVRYPATDGLIDIHDETKCGETTGPWCRPSIHMPRWASRIALEVTGVRVERLNDISEADALAEGIEPSLSPPGFSVMVEDGGCFWQHADNPRGVPAVGDEAMGQRVVHVQPTPAKALTTAKERFTGLWLSINGAGSWAANPWVWVIEFKTVTALAA